MTLSWPLEDPDTYLLDCPSESLFSDEMEGPSPASWGVFDRQRFQTPLLFSGGLIIQKKKKDKNNSWTQQPCWGNKSKERGWDG